MESPHVAPVSQAEPRGQHPGLRLVTSQRRTYRNPAVDRAGIDLLIESVEIGRVSASTRLAVGLTAADLERTYATLADEVLRSALRTIAGRPGFGVLDLNLEKPKRLPAGGTLRAVAVAVPLGERTIVATTSITLRGRVRGRGSMTALLAHSPAMWVADTFSCVRGLTPARHTDATRRISTFS